MMLLPRNVERVVPSWFASQLRSLDPNLIVYFNPHRERWIIDRCTRGGERNAALHDHTPECPRTNVLVVEDHGRYMPLCDRVLDDLRAKDTWTQFGTVEAYQAHNAEQLATHDAKRDKAIDDLYRETSADNRRQLQQAYHLTQQHDTARLNR